MFAIKQYSIVEVKEFRELKNYLSATNSFECMIPYLQGGEVNPETFGCLTLIPFDTSLMRSSGACPECFLYLFV